MVLEITTWPAFGA